MTTKTKRPRFRYSAEELTPQDRGEDEAFADAFVKESRDHINGDLKAARASVAQGAGKTYGPADDLVAEVMGKVRPRKG